PAHARLAAASAAPGPGERPVAEPVLQAPPHVVEGLERPAGEPLGGAVLGEGAARAREHLVRDRGRLAIREPVTDRHRVAPLLARRTDRACLVVAEGRAVAEDAAPAAGLERVRLDREARKLPGREEEVDDLPEARAQDRQRDLTRDAPAGEGHEAGV